MHMSGVQFSVTVRRLEVSPREVCSRESKKNLSSKTLRQSTIIDPLYLLTGVRIGAPEFSRPE